MYIISENQKDISFDLQQIYNSGPSPDELKLDNISHLTHIKVYKHHHGLNVTVGHPGSTYVNKPARSSGTKILVLNLPFFDNYGHCLHDVIPKLLWYDRNHAADIIYTCSSTLLISLLSLFEIKFTKIRFVETDIDLTANNIYIENHPGYHIRDKEKNRVLKTIIDKRCDIINTSRERNLLIYCTRNHSTDTNHGRMMDKKNETILISILKSYCKSNGLQFTLFTGQENNKTMCHKKQMLLFNQAKLVIGPHGSAMANTIYLNPENKPIVCEFTSGTEVQIHGGVFNKHYDFLNGGLLSELYQYYLIPFTITSSPEITLIDINNLKTFLNMINL